MVSGFDESGAIPPSFQTGLVETADELDSASKEGGSRSVAMETRTDRLGTEAQDCTKMLKYKPVLCDGGGKFSLM